MVGVDVVGTFPAQSVGRLVGLLANQVRVGPDYGVFPVALVPDRGNLDAGLPGRDKGFELGLSLSGKAVAAAH